MTQSAELKAYEEKISAQLHETKVRLDEFETHFKGHIAEAENQIIHELKATQLEIEKKRHELNTAVAAKATHLKTEIDADLAKLKAASDRLAAKIKGHAAKA